MRAVAAPSMIANCHHQRGPYGNRDRQAEEGGDIAALSPTAHDRAPMSCSRSSARPPARAPSSCKPRSGEQRCGDAIDQGHPQPRDEGDHEPDSSSPGSNILSIGTLKNLAIRNASGSDGR